MPLPAQAAAQAVAQAVARQLVAAPVPVAARTAKGNNRDTLMLPA
jgi:hypothetical protein